MSSMVRLKFRGKDLPDLDLWTKSDPFLVLSRPARNEQGWVQISVFDYDSSSNHDLIGSVQLTLAEMQTMAQSGSQAKLGGGEKERGLLCVTECKVEQPLGEEERRRSRTAYPSRKGSSPA
eukprot:GFUD01084767.1.p1 GENE.GFUD01084767.1~~GFUD01084767.1.p1  ORF type:complete len:121 (-),score=32.92 GFUD01084767.1:306-668(-)